MANPLVKIIVPLAGIAAAAVGNKVATTGWSAVFGEEAPTKKNVRSTDKETQKLRKQAKKEGKSKAEIEQMVAEQDSLPVWKTILWTVLSGLVLQGLKMAAREGAQRGTERLTRRRPKPNRG